jgi:predicted regulator of Ras-like GTPase activity (Roadblock/LC7/MglB family)
MSQLAHRLEAALADLLRALPEIEAAALVTVDGLPMASVLPDGMNEDRVAAMSAALLSLGERAADGLGRGGLAQVSIEGEDGSVHLLAAGEDAVLVAVASAGAKAGLVLFELRRTAAELGDELGRSDERFSQSGAESIDALADLAAVLPVQAAAHVEFPTPTRAPAAAPTAEAPAIPDVAPASAPYFPSYEPSLPGVGTALAGLEPPYPVLNQHVPTPPEPPATSWPTWS